MKNFLGVQNMRICPHAIRVLEKNSNFMTEEPNPSALKTMKVADKVDQPLPDGTHDKEVRKSDSLEDDGP